MPARNQIKNSRLLKRQHRSYELESKDCLSIPNYACRNQKLIDNLSKSSFLHRAKSN
ncbi:hypothetical protein glysoja_019540 [Glycine soja]|nr:hypothetical protein glysoja_019540 [Glycine soja]